MFPDVTDEVRNRGGNKVAKDDWQLEILCNLAASEFVMPIGSLSAREKLTSIEDLMTERRKFDVSAEAFLIRVTKIANEPVVMFCASADAAAEEKTYRVDYAVSSASAPNVPISGFRIPRGGTVYSCAAIGFTTRGVEKWFNEKKATIECVGIPGYPGSSSPRVAGLIRFAKAEMTRTKVNFVHGDVLKAQGSEPKVMSACK